MRNRIELALVILWAVSLGWDLGGYVIDHETGPRFNDCSTGIPEEIFLEERMAMFHGNLGCGVIWLTGSEEL